jgi:hypothetical protein
LFDTPQAVEPARSCVVRVEVWFAMAAAFERAAALQVRRDPSGAEGVIADLGLDAGRGRWPAAEAWWCRVLALGRQPRQTIGMVTG